jgi:CubicO group peptidase (beta-lactamase class C family)
MQRLSPLAMAIGLCFCAAANAQTTPALADTDRDGRPDLLDNCVQVANPDQRDSNNNGIGDRCDADVNGDGIVNAVDLALLRAQFGQTGGPADLNGDGTVNALDLALLRTRFGQRPGPVGEVLQRLRQIDPRVPPEGPSVQPESPPPDPSSPAVLLPQVLALFDQVIGQISGPPQATLLRLRMEAESALAHLRDGDNDGSLGYLVRAAAAMQRADPDPLGHFDIQDLMSQYAVPLRQIRTHLLTATRSTLEGLLNAMSAGGVSTAAQQTARAFHQQGLSLQAAGQIGPALQAFGLGLTAATPLLRFDIDLFEARLRSVFDAQSVGWAYSIARAGTLQRSGSLGLARTAADLPATLQRDDKRMQVASVSKTLTAIVVLRLLADRGLPVDTPIGPWLPSHWVQGAGVFGLTFRDLMTHRSGFDQNGVAGSDYASLRDVIARPVGDTSFDYSNPNFGLLRVLAARLAGVDAADYGEFDGGQLTAAVFMFRAQLLYGNVGVPFHCSNEAVAPTRQYHFPDTGASGYLDPDRTLQCGGYGVNISANNLARVLSFWRYTNDLLPTSMRNAMRQQHLGLMDPARYGFAGGTFGVYQGHGGDWNHSNGDADTCMFSFPNLIEAAVVINSSRRNSGGYVPRTHQCSVLKWAYEGAWVAN